MMVRCLQHTYSNKKEAARLIGNKGNLAIANKIAPALERCKREDIVLDFSCCNLDEQVMLRLASAVEKSTCIGKIYCKWNPGNNALTEEAMKRAIIASKSPIEKWNNAELEEDIVPARREREDNPFIWAAKEETRKTEVFLSSLNTRVPTRDEFDLAQRGAQSIPNQLASKDKELKVGLDQLARGEAEKKTLETRIHELQVQVQEVRKKNDEFRYGNDKVKAEMDALKNAYIRHEALIERAGAQGFGCPS